ncbi:methanobactin export MATE transporter MbnM [Glaciecola petra]|uniref:Di-heme enzyme n=1 Tax=Glaciecola petra TaxID=3075602 RepID=A0ABU2ZU50_9ALTE|nr:methanobactin export MATE transporter MbnM [Aestuariibacter sp. P117]MDT0596125.1 di-heme enzyme [Aestuariibacter sp. P117]
MTLIIAIAFLSQTSCTPKQQQFEWQIPPGFPLPEVPANNPITQAKVNLGKALFYEPALSGNRAMSCATCHDPAHAFSEPKALSSGSTGKILQRNALALVNVAYNSNFTWAHSGLSSIEQQMMIPLFSESPIEMGLSGQQYEVIKRFQTEDYETLFEQAWGDKTITLDRMVKSIASFVRSLTSFDSPFDEYAYRANDDALNESELRGLDLFFSERLECFHCHGGFNFTQSSKHEFQPLDLRPFHNTALYNEDGVGSYPLRDQGLYEQSLNANDMGRFRAPTLRNIEYTAPYMHDGSVATLRDLIQIYADGGRETGVTSPIKSPFISGFELTQQESDDLLAFLHSLSDKKFINNPSHHAPINPPKVN